MALSLRATETKIPQAPGQKGKENLRAGRGAKIVKPVSIRKQDLRSSSVSGILTETSQDSNTSVYRRGSTTDLKPGLGLVLQSKAVPDIHQKLLSKIRQNKRRSLERTTSLTEAPCRAPPASQDRESPVSGPDLQMYLLGVFDIADKYKSGTVSAGSLLECITGLVDLPKLDKWKLEELKRMLDPKNDNRYVDAATWSVVGQSWVEMMLNPGKS